MPTQVKRLPPLHTLAGLRALGARILRESMKGERPVDEGSKLMAMVRVQAELISGEALEGKLTDLEQATKHKAGVPIRFPRRVA